MKVRLTNSVQCLQNIQRYLPHNQKHITRERISKGLIKQFITDVAPLACFLTIHSSNLTASLGVEYQVTRHQATILVGGEHIFNNFEHTLDILHEMFEIDTL
jgi:hypothetical protein